jgi:hypothetical protein
MKWTMYTLGALLLVGGLMFAGYSLMPTKPSWAKEFAEYSQSLPEDASLRQELQPLLSDGKISLWELSQLHCQYETGCTIDSFLSTYTNPEASDMFAEMVLAILKARGARSSDSQQGIDG